MLHKRKCIGCGIVKDRDTMIKITYDKKNNEVIINQSKRVFGRSVYLCYNKECISSALRKNRMDKMLKCTVSDNLKGKLIEYEQ